MTEVTAQLRERKIEMYDCTLCRDNSPDAFDKACEIIDKAFPNAQKCKLLIDVDGSTYQAYTVNGAKITILDDYDVGAVYIQADIDLSYLSLKKTIIKEQLIEKLYEVFDDRDFVLGVISIVRKVPEMQEVLEYIEKNEEVTSSDVLGLALDINMKSPYCSKKYQATDRRVVFMNSMMRRNRDRRVNKDRFHVQNENKRTSKYPR